MSKQYLSYILLKSLLMSLPNFFRQHHLTVISIVLLNPKTVKNMNEKDRTHTTAVKVSKMSSPFSKLDYRNLIIMVLGVESYEG